MRPTKSFLETLGLAGIAALVVAAMSGSASAATATRPRNNPTALSSRGEAFIKQEEGFDPRAYKDGKNAAGLQLYSIGYGHQITGGDGLTKDSVIDAAKGHELFRKDVASREALISKGVTVPLTQNQFDALVSLAYNIGLTAFKNSTLLRVLNAGDYTEARRQFHVWNKSGGAVHPVLVGRREREANLFATV